MQFFRIIKTITATAFFSCFTFLSSCLGIMESIVEDKIIEAEARKKVNVENGAIPPEFSDEKRIMLLIRHDDDWGYNKMLVKKWGNFEGGFRLITNDDTLREQYRDKDLYRYIFNFGRILHEIGVDQSTGQVYKNESNTPYIYDRKNKKMYFVDYISSRQAPIIAAYVYNLNKEQNKISIRFK